MSVIISIIFLLSCFKRPMFGLALMLQTNIIRSLINIDYVDPCFACINESDILLGAITPILCFVVILLRFDFKSPIKYVIDIYDVFFIAAILILFFTSFYATDIVESLNYSFRFLLLGVGYFFITKIILLNTNKYEDAFKAFLIYSLWLAIIFGTFGGILYLLKGFGQGAYRLTIPGVHPIPFSQLIGLGIITSFIIFITNGSYFNIKSKFKLNINKALLPYLVLLLLATQTRGVMLSLAVSILFYLVLAKIKIRKSILYTSAFVMILAVFLAIQYIDFEVLFERMLAKQTASSVDNRLIAYSDSLSIFLEHPFGIGPDAFKYYSILPYPHNLFLELLAQYGIFGLLISLYLILLILFMSFIVKKTGNRSLTHIILMAIFFYYFIEAMFSFTLWMHKGLFLYMGLFAGYHYRFKRK